MARRSFDLVTGSRAAAVLASKLSTAPLRVLGFHGIDSPQGFRDQLDFAEQNFTFVDHEAVVRWAGGEGELPDRAVWLTFDDGDPSIVTHALPELRRRSIQATAFICPGMVDTESPFWWQVVAAATAADLEGVRPLSEYKAMDDFSRRRQIDGLQRELETWGWVWAGSQMTSRQLDEWVALGHAIGNHTWDHPLLDRCTPDEERKQIHDAHAWIGERFPGSALLFAYPNGNWSAGSEKLLVELGYRVGLMFDHRVTRRANPLKLSRLRTNADGNIHRFRSSISGIHPMVTSLRSTRYVDA